MDTVTLVEAQVDDGQRLLDHLTQEGVAVRSACWLKPEDEDRWSLYIVTPAVDDKGPMEAYREVLRVLRSLGDAWITSSDIKLIGQEHPIARDLLGLQQQRFSGKVPARRPVFGGMPVDDLHLYLSGNLEFPVYGMAFQGDPLGPFYLSFEPHDPNCKLTVGIGGQSKEYPAKTGIDWVVAAPDGAALERDEIGRMVLGWQLHGHRVTSPANEVWSFAKLGLNGFRFLREPA